MSCCYFEHTRLGPRPETQEDVNRRVERIVSELRRKLSEQKESAGMGAFNINITGVGGHGCERKAKAGDKLYGRCGRFSCPDCAAYDFVQRMKQAGSLREDSQAYNVEVTADDPLVVDYLTRLAAFQPLPHEQGPKRDQDEVSRSLAFRDVYNGPIWRNDSDGKYYRKVPFQALFTHWPETPNQVVDDMLRNERKEGAF